MTSRDEIGMLTRSFNAMVAELKLKARIKETFGRYVDPRIVQGLIDQPDLLAGKGDRRVMTVLFCDLWNSTALGELTTPAGLVTIINRYLAKMSGPVRSHDGIIDKYMGDGLMAFWGPPFVGAEEQARLACEAALDQVAALPALAAELPELLGIRRGLPTLAIRVGIATGDVLVGNIGSDTARSYTVMGGTVNLASRLEGINRRYGTSILASAATARLAADAIEFREVDAAIIAGLAEPEPVFEVLGRKGEVAATVLQARDRFAEGLAAFRTGDRASRRRGLRGLSRPATGRPGRPRLPAAARGSGLAALYAPRRGRHTTLVRFGVLCLLLLPLAAMTMIVVASNWLVQFPINDLLTWGAITYPFSFLVTDLTTRLHGPASARRVVWAGFALAVLLSIWLSTPRIALASGTAFLAGQLLDIQVFQRLRTGSWWRAPLVSSTVGSILDTALFFSLAFAGTALPWMTLALGDLGVKLVLAVLALAPFRAVLALALPAAPVRT